MSQCRKEGVSSPISKYLLIFATGLLLLSFSVRASAQDDTRKTPPPPPPHPKPKTLKEMVEKVKTWNPFKKHKDDAATDNTTASTSNDKKADPTPTPPPPDPKPQPSVVKPKTTTGATHKSTKKKTTTKPKSSAPPPII